MTLPKGKTDKTAVKAVRRKRRSADDIMNRIVRAAGEEFKRSGYTGTTTATIARKADVTEAQLFRYFGSKSNLFRETVFKPIDQLLLNFTNDHMSDVGKAESSREMARLFTTELQRFITEHSEMLTSLVVAQTYDAGTAHGVGKINSLGAYFDHSTNMMARRLKGKQKVDPQLTVRMAFVAVLGSVMFRDWIFPPGLASDEEIEAAVSQFVLKGISADPG